MQPKNEGEFRNYLEGTEFGYLTDFILLLQNIAQAIDLASDAIQLNPNNYEGYHLRAKSYMEQGDFEMALSDSKRALKLSQMTASAEIKTILIRYHDEVIRLQSAHKTTDL